MAILRPVLSAPFGRDIRLAAAHAGLSTVEDLHDIVHPLVQDDLRRRQQAAGLVEAVRTTIEDGVPVVRGDK